MNKSPLAYNQLLPYKGLMGDVNRAIAEYCIVWKICPNGTENAGWAAYFSPETEMRVSRFVSLEGRTDFV